MLPRRGTKGSFVRDALAAIISYLAEHPHSNDTLQGVTQWWLLAESATWSRAEIQEGLDKGVEKGLILQTRGGDGQVRYSLMPGKFPEIRGYLKLGPES